MTKAAFATHDNRAHLINNPISEIGDTACLPFDHRLIRSAIVSARPVMPDDLSRRAKMMAARKIWNESRPIVSSLAETYLSACGITSDELTTYLRFHPSVLHEPTRETMPAMIAPVHGLDGEFVGIHKTYLAPDGKSRAFCFKGTDRRMLGQCFGEHVQLSHASGFRMVLTESIEMALHVRQSCEGLPVWAAMTLGNMKAPVPSSVKELILCADGVYKDPNTARKILMDAAREHIGRGITVLIASLLGNTDVKSLQKD